MSILDGDQEIWGIPVGVTKYVPTAAFATWVLDAKYAGVLQKFIAGVDWMIGLNHGGAATTIFLTGFAIGFNSVAAVRLGLYHWFGWDWTAPIYNALDS